MRRVAVTGASGLIGRNLLEHLEADDTVERIVAVDLAEPPLDSHKLVFTRHDVRDPMDAVFRDEGITEAVHLAFLVDPRHDRERERGVNVEGTRHFLRACHEAQVSTVLLASSGTVYGAWPDNPPRLTEDAPLRGKPGFGYVEDKLELEAAAAAFAAEHPLSRVLLIRPTVVAGPHMDNYLSRLLLKPVSFAIRGADPPTPLVHEEDVGRAIHHLLKEAPAGAYNIDAPDPVPLSELARLLGSRVLRLPAGVLRGLAGLAWRLHLQSISEAPPAMIDYIRWSWVLDGTKITRETTFRYRYTALQAMEDFLRGRTHGGTS